MSTHETKELAGCEPTAEQFNFAARLLRECVQEEAPGHWLHHDGAAAVLIAERDRVWGKAVFRRAVDEAIAILQEEAATHPDDKLTPVERAVERLEKIKANAAGSGHCLHEKKE